MTSITTPPPKSLFYPLREVRGLPAGARVDRERRIIFGVAMIQLGKVNDDRPFLIDETTLQQTEDLTRAKTKGLKCRFKHPNASSDGLGSFLGRLRRPRHSDDRTIVLADLHLSSMAFRGKRADLGASLGDYVLDLAENDPDVFGMSLAPEADEEAMQSLRNADGVMPMRFKNLKACDVVDDPAATRGGLFGDADLSVTPANAPAIATALLDRLFADADADTVFLRSTGLIENYVANRFGRDTLKETDMSDTAKALTLDDVNKAIDEKNKTNLSAIEKLIDSKLSKLSTPPGKGDNPPADPPNEGVIRAAERKRCSELSALAKNAGLDEYEKVAQDWIDKGLSVDAAHAALGQLVVEQNMLTRDSGSGDDDPKAKYRAEYRQNAAALAAVGTTEEEFVRSRMIDDGAEMLSANFGK